MDDVVEYTERVDPNEIGLLLHICKEGVTHGNGLQNIVAAAYARLAYINRNFPRDYFGRVEDDPVEVEQQPMEPKVGEDDPPPNDPPVEGATTLVDRRL